MGDMTKRTADPLGQLHLFGQLDIFDQAADLESAAAPAPAPAVSFLDPEHRINRRLAARYAREDRRAALEAAVEQGRADVAAGFDPFAGITLAEAVEACMTLAEAVGLEHKPERATGRPTSCARCGATVWWDHAARQLAHTSR